MSKFGILKLTTNPANYHWFRLRRLERPPRRQDRLNRISTDVCQQPPADEKKFVAWSLFIPATSSPHHFRGRKYIPAKSNPSLWIRPIIEVASRFEPKYTTLPVARCLSRTTSRSSRTRRCSQPLAALLFRRSEASPSPDHNQ